MNTSKNTSKAFTLIELLVVIAIIGLLSLVVSASINSARVKARDARRLSDIRQIQNALELYYDKYGRYPTPDYDGCGGWDTGSQDYPLLNGRMDEDIMYPVPVDPSKSGNCTGYRYFRYGAGTSGCDASKGAFYVLGIVDIEGSGRPHSDSPGWSCPSRNWQSEFDWVVGQFEY